MAAGQQDVHYAHADCCTVGVARGLSMAAEDLQASEGSQASPAQLADRRKVLPTHRPAPISQIHILPARNHDTDCTCGTSMTAAAAALLTTWTML